MNLKGTISFVALAKQIIGVNVWDFLYNDNLWGLCNVFKRLFDPQAKGACKGKTLLPLIIEEFILYYF